MMRLTQAVDRSPSIISFRDRASS